MTGSTRQSENRGLGFHPPQKFFSISKIISGLSVEFLGKKEKVIG